MRILQALSMAALVVFAFGTSEAAAATAGSISCVHSNTTTCTSGFDDTNLSSNPTVEVAGYNSPGDEGGGVFSNMGACSGGTNAATGTGTQGSRIVDVTTKPASPIIPGSLIQTSASNFLPNTQVVAYNPNDPAGPHGTITVSIAPTSSFVKSSLNLTYGNGGTLFVDTSGTCFYRTSYRGDPHEWGAIGNGMSPNTDTTALQNWLAGPGPWDATVPAIYQVNQGLYCWPGVNIRTPSNQNSGTASVTIQAVATGGTWSTTYPALMTMGSNCRISGLSLDANNNPASGSPHALDTILIDENAVKPIIDQYAVLKNGYHNVDCPYYGGGNGADGLRISDAALVQSVNSNVELDQCNNNKMSNDVISNSGTQGIVFAKGADFDLWDSVIQQSGNQGLLLSGGLPDQGTIVGNFFDSNGQSGSGAGIELDNVANFTICGNHFNRNDNNNGLTGSSHILFGSGTISSVTLCGNDYLASQQGNQGLTVPSYVYDVGSGVSGIDTITLYENPQAQQTGVFSGEACKLGLNTHQVLPNGATGSCTITPRKSKSGVRHEGRRAR